MTRTWDFVRVKRKPKKRKPRKDANRALFMFVVGLLCISYDIINSHVTWLTYVGTFACAGNGVLWAFYSRPRGGRHDDDDNDDEGGAA